MTADAVHAYKEVIKRNPKDAGSLIGAASAFCASDSSTRRSKHAELAVSVAPAGAHELLAKIALARHDRDTARARSEAGAGGGPDAADAALRRGTPAYNEGQYADALGPADCAPRDSLQGRTVQMNDLNYYIGDSLARLERYGEAEPYLLEEIRVFPHNTRARAGLAMLYRAMGRDADSERAIAELLRVSPTAKAGTSPRSCGRCSGSPRRRLRLRVGVNPRSRGPRGEGPRGARPP